MPFAADRTYVGGVSGQVQAVDILFRCLQAFKRPLGFLPSAVMTMGESAERNLLVVFHLIDRIRFNLAAQAQTHAAFTFSTTWKIGYDPAV